MRVWCGVCVDLLWFGLRLGAGGGGGGGGTDDCCGCVPGWAWGRARAEVGGHTGARGSLLSGDSRAVGRGPRNKFIGGRHPVTTRQTLTTLHSATQSI